MLLQMSAKNRWKENAIDRPPNPICTTAKLEKILGAIRERLEGDLHHWRIPFAT